MPSVASSVLLAIGNTPLIRLTRVVPPGAADVLVKLESVNPTGSYNDRMALAMIEGAEARGALRHLAVMRYDAFGDMGGQLSWSLALLDDAGDGVVITSIHGRSDARTYAKTIVGWSSDQQLSPEEEEALANAKPR